jgi:ABC-type dipeptide/oligopeptide/nickel transport system permease component
MKVVRKVSWIFGRNLIGFVAIAILIAAISFLPLAIRVMPKQYEQDVFQTSWGEYGKGLVSYFNELMHGDLGSLQIKLRYADSTLDIMSWVVDLVERSVQLIVPGVLFGMVLGVAMGALTFFLPTWARRVSDSVNQVLFSMPDLLIIILLQLLGISLNKWYGSYFLAIADFGKTKAFWLPVMCLAIPIAAYVYRATVASCQEVLNQEYVRTARAKGLPDRVIFFKHVLRPALDPILGLMPKMVAFAASSMVLVEKLFNIRGVTWFFFEPRQLAAMSKLLATILICLAAIVVIVNTVTSMLRLWVNPALRR